MNLRINKLISLWKESKRVMTQHSRATNRLLSSSPISIPSSSSTSLSAVTLPANKELRQNLKDTQCYDDQLSQSGQQKIIFSDSVNRGTFNDEEEKRQCHWWNGTEHKHYRISNMLLISHIHTFIAITNINYVIILIIHVHKLFALSHKASYYVGKCEF